MLNTAPHTFTLIMKHVPDLFGAGSPTCPQPQTGPLPPRYLMPLQSRKGGISLLGSIFRFRVSLPRQSSDYVQGFFRRENFPVVNPKSSLFFPLYSPSPSLKSDPQVPGCRLLGDRVCCLSWEYKRTMREC